MSIYDGVEPSDDLGTGLSSPRPASLRIEAHTVGLPKPEETAHSCSNSCFAGGFTTESVLISGAVMSKEALEKIYNFTHGAGQGLGAICQTAAAVFFDLLLLIIFCDEAISRWRCPSFKGQRNHFMKVSFNCLISRILHLIKKVDSPCAVQCSSCSGLKL